MSNVPLRVIQISDAHLFAKSDAELLGVKTHDSFRAVLDLIHQQEKNIDFIIFSGDLSQDASDEAYIKIAALLDPLQVPVYYVPGNHDDAALMMQLYPRDNISGEKHVVLGNWHFIFLNSQKPGAVEGYLDETQLDYLHHCLQRYPKHHAAIILHHQPLRVGCAWLDKLGLTNASDFWQVISRFPSVKTVLFGHVHQANELSNQNVTCYSVPSTCIQFKTKQDHFGLDNLPPGYRWVNLYTDGKVETGINRVEKYIGVFDAGAKGY